MLYLYINIIYNNIFAIEPNLFINMHAFVIFLPSIQVILINLINNLYTYIFQLRYSGSVAIDTTIYTTDALIYNTYT